MVEIKSEEIVLVTGIVWKESISLWLVVTIAKG